MNKQEKIKLIQELVDHYQKLNNNFNSIYELFGNADSKFTDSVWNGFDSYMRAVQLLTEDVFDWIPWYIYDNKCGKGNMECEVRGGVKVKVRTVKQLVEAIDDV